MISTFCPSLGPEELGAVRSVFDSRWLGMGEVTNQFERRLAQFLGARHVVAVGCGTAALHLALDALELEPEAEVLVPSLTFVATIQAIRMAGATPVFCEVKPETLNLDPADAVARITSRTRVILPVHYAGLPCDMDGLLAEARPRGLRVVEDAAHAFGARYQGRPVGTVGDLTCFSFDAIKNITCGEGGAVTTEDAELARRIACRRKLGIDTRFPPASPEEASWPYHVLTHGFRYHLPDLNAAIGLVQLARFPAFQERKREIVRRYDAAFANLPDVEPLEHDLEQTCPWAYVVKVPGPCRDAFREHLHRHGVATLIQFVPNHLQPAFAPWRADLPATERLCQQIVSLPLHVDMTDADVETVAQAVRSFAGWPRRFVAACGPTAGKGMDAVAR
jgi:perosamine synthetase